MIKETDLPSLADCLRLLARATMDIHDRKDAVEWMNKLDIVAHSGGAEARMHALFEPRALNPRAAYPMAFTVTNTCIVYRKDGVEVKLPFTWMGGTVSILLPGTDTLLKNLITQYVKECMEYTITMETLVYRHKVSGGVVNAAE